MIMRGSYESIFYVFSKFYSLKGVLYMSYKFVKNLTTVNYTKGNDGRKYIVIHYTGNREDSSLANSNYFKSINRGASAHYFVDKTSVYQVVDDNNTAWAVGKNYGGNNLFGKCTNRNSCTIKTGVF